MRFLAIIIVFCFILGGCAGSNSRALKQADAIMEQDADSALRILERIDRSQLGNGELPYFALLMTQALVKTSVPLDSDSLISIAYKKYDGSWRGDKGIRSNFYMGEVFYNQEKPRNAMRYYLTAYEESKRLSNDYWRAKSAERIADLFFDAYNYAEAAKYRKEAIKYFGKSDRVTNQRYAVADLATEYINDSQFEQSMHLLDSVYEITNRENPENTHLIEYIRRIRIGALVSSGRTNELTDSDMKLLEDGMQATDSLDSKILRLEIEDTRIPHKLNEKEFMDILSSAKTAEDKAFTLYAYYKHIKLQTDASIEHQVVDSLLFYQNAVVEKLIKESAVGAERDFFKDISVQNKRKSEIYLICFFTACIVIFCLWRTFRIRTLANKAELEANIESFMELKAISERLATEKSKLEEMVMEKGKFVEKIRETLAEKSKKVEQLEKEIFEAELDKSRLENSIGEKDEVTNKLNEALKEKILSIQSLKKDIDELKSSIDLQSHEMEMLKRNIDLQSSDLRSKDIVLETLFKEKWSTLNMLCDEYYERGEFPNTRKQIIDRIEKELKKIGSKKGLAQIEEAVDTRFDGIISLLKHECPQLSERDITMAILITAGFSPKAISYLMGIKTGNFYVSKRRLLDRISASEAPDKDIFISRLI